MKSFALFSTLWNKIERGITILVVKTLEVEVSKAACARLVSAVFINQ